jgi:hypothetical protein
MNYKINSFTPQSGQHLLDNSSVFNTANQIVNTTTSFNDVRVREETPQFVWKSSYPLSSLRDKFTRSNNGDVVKDGSEIVVSSTSDTGSIAEIQSRQNGDYIPGAEYVPGMGIRIPTLPTNAVIQVGYFDSSNGLYFEFTNDTAYVVRKKGGTIAERIEQSDWNIDKVNGAGKKENPSNVTLSMADGHVLRMPFLYYGYGYCRFEVGLFDKDERVHRIQPVHVMPINGETSLDKSNLPLTVRVEGNGEATSCFLGGRQTSVVGKVERIFREVGEVRKDVAVSSTDWYPMLSIQAKTAFNNVFLQIGRIEVLSSGLIEYAVFKDATLTGASFGTPNLYDTDETATEWDSSATALTGGNLIAGIFLGTGSNQNNQLGKERLPDFPITNGETITLAVRKLSGAGTETVTLAGAVKENW